VTSESYVSYQEGNGLRRKGKGSHRQHTTTIQATPEGLNIMALPADTAPTLDVTHGFQCSTLWGEDGTATSAAFLMHGSINGSSNTVGTGLVRQWDGLTRAYTNDTMVTLGTAIDTGWLSNIYGENPNTQGRNFLHCLGNVANPGYGIDGGFMSDVKTFVAIPAATRRLDPLTGMNEDKLSLQLQLIPAVTAPPAGQDPPDDTNPDDTNPDDTNPDDTNPDPTNPDTDSSTGALGGCNAGSSSTGTGSLALLGLALLFVRRRRN
jgi:MYXO-CTERM domain-containing protein